MVSLTASGMPQSVTAGHVGGRLKIVDLTLENVHDSIGLCIGSKPGYEHAREEKRRWLEKYLPYGVGGKLAYLDERIVGMLEYSPIEYAPFPVAGNNLLHINCIWVLPQFQRMTAGEGLVKSCVSEALSRGKKGLSVLSYDGTFLMPSTFFLHQGFRRVQRRGSEELMWKELEPSQPPAFLHHEFSPEKNSKKVYVEILCSAQCPWSIMTRQRLERVSRGFGRTVKVHSLRIDDRESVEKFGASRKVFVNGNESFLFPPTEDDIRQVLETSAKDLTRRRPSVHWTELKVASHQGS